MTVGVGGQTSTPQLFAPSTLAVVSGGLQPVELKSSVAYCRLKEYDCIQFESNQIESTEFELSQCNAIRIKAVR